jgi:hypothetical protein
MFPTVQVAGRRETGRRVTYGLRQRSPPGLSCRERPTAHSCARASCEECSGMIASGTNSPRPERKREMAPTASQHHPAASQQAPRDQIVPRLLRAAHCCSMSPAHPQPRCSQSPGPVATRSGCGFGRGNCHPSQTAFPAHQLPSSRRPNESDVQRLGRFLVPKPTVMLAPWNEARKRRAGAGPRPLLRGVGRPPLAIVFGAPSWCRQR